MLIFTLFSPLEDPPRANSGVIDTFLSTGTVPIAKMLSITPLFALGGSGGPVGGRGKRPFFDIG